MTGGDKTSVIAFACCKKNYAYQIRFFFLGFHLCAENSEVSKWWSLIKRDKWGIDRIFFHRKYSRTIRKLDFLYLKMQLALDFKVFYIHYRWQLKNFTHGSPWVFVKDLHLLSTIPVPWKDSVLGTMLMSPTWKSWIL